MPGSATRVVVSIAALSLSSGVGMVHAQTLPSRRPEPTRVVASMRAGHVVGVVKDQAGLVVAGVAVTAIGTSQAQAKTDLNGYFRLALVPGDYILRASRDGYVSPYRESVRIRAASEIERNITITRQPTLTDRRIMAAGISPRVGDPDPLPVEPIVRPASKSGTLHAWYLRHLPRTVLRDGNGQPEVAPKRADFRYLPGFLDWAVAGSARAATSFFSETDFTGQFNMLSSSALSSIAGSENALPRGVAYLSVGAPVGTHGDWRLRGAMSTAGLASWVALAEYEARDIQTHAFRVGMSYGAQRHADSTRLPAAVTSDGNRTVASVFGVDHWRVHPRLELNYGARVDRYDYVEGRNFVSPRVGARVTVIPRTFVSVSAAQTVLAPGIDEFTPPPASGPWLPPERSFAPLFAGAALVPERIRRVDVGATREFGLIGRGHTVGVRWYREATRDQLATVFGAGAGRDLGHYYVASVGDVSVDGWAVHASSWVSSRVRMAVDYTLARAQWSRTAGPGLAAVMPNAARPTREDLHDITGSLDARIPESDTHVLVAYRLNSALIERRAAGVATLADGRFDLQLRQALPFQPLAGSRIEVLFAINNLFRDPAGELATGAFYDELLTLRTPRRVLGGVQVRF